MEKCDQVLCKRKYRSSTAAQQDTIQNSENIYYKFSFGQKLNMFYVCPGQGLLYIM